MIHYKKLFLIDSLGATLTALLLGVLLPNVREYIGMPSKVLYVLAAQAFLYAVYSMLMYLSSIKKWQPYMKGIAIANAFYCVITISLMSYFHPQLTALGIAYFLVEVIIIMSLSVLEWKMAKDDNN